MFNQAVAHVVETLGVSALQFHDYHGGWVGGGGGAPPRGRMGKFGVSRDGLI